MLWRDRISDKSQHVTKDRIPYSEYHYTGQDTNCRTSRKPGFDFRQGKMFLSTTQGF